MKNLQLSIIISIILIFIPSSFIFSQNDDSELKIKCYNYCKLKNNNCMDKSNKKKKEKQREKSIKICGYFFADCMKRCEKN